MVLKGSPNEEYLSREQTTFRQIHTSSVVQNPSKEEFGMMLLESYLIILAGRSTHFIVCTSIEVGFQDSQAGHVLQDVPVDFEPHERQCPAQV